MVDYAFMGLARALFKTSNAWMYARTRVTEPWRDSACETIIAIDNVKLRVRPHTSDTHVIHTVLRKKPYGEDPRGIVVDLGANIGAYSLFAARTADRVFAFEPERSNYALLDANINLNNVAAITRFKKAVGGRRGFVALHILGTNKGASSTAVPHSSTVQYVEMVTLDDVFTLCGIKHIDVLKIDIEGSEYELFENASLNTLQRINTIAMQTHVVRGKYIAHIDTKLHAAGFDVHTRNTGLIPFGMRMMTAQRRTT
jgi:FkbM family methyltransferase